MTWKTESTLTTAPSTYMADSDLGNGTAAGRFNVGFGGDGDGHNMCGMIGFAKHGINLGFEGRGLERFDLEELNGAGYATGYRDGGEDGDAVED